MKRALAAVGSVAFLAAGIVAVIVFRPAGKVAIPPAGTPVQAGEPFPHRLWTEVLRKHSKDGLVDYRGLQADHAGFDAYLGFVAAMSPESHPAVFPRREDRLAYAINAYNAYVVKGVLDHYPCESVRSVGLIPSDFFRKFEYPFGGRSWTLHAWETKLRAEFGEPRVHFALNCASLGCPRLPAEAFEPSRLEEQLARETAAFLAEPRNVSREGSRTRLSQVFEWYRGDFEDWMAVRGKPPDVTAWIREHGGDADGDPEFAPWDWALNDRR